MFLLLQGRKQKLEKPTSHMAKENGSNNKKDQVIK
jgi:hypothetical protein